MISPPSENVTGIGPAGSAIFIYFPATRSFRIVKLDARRRAQTVITLICLGWKHGLRGKGRRRQYGVGCDWLEYSGTNLQILYVVVQHTKCVVA